MSESEREDIRHQLEESFGPDSLLARLESQTKAKAKKQQEKSK